MDAASHEQTELLRGIWNEMKTLGSNLGGRIDMMRTEVKAEIRETNARLDDTNARLDDTNGRLDVANGRLGAVEGVLKELAGQQVLLGRYVKHVVDRHESAIDDLHDRVVRLETRLEERE